MMNSPPINLAIKLLNSEARIPEYACDLDAGCDLYATSISQKTDKPFIEYGTGIAVQIPPGYAGLIYPRSSVSKMGLSICNSVGIVDSGYLDEIKVRFYIESENHKLYEVGDRIAQLIIQPVPRIIFNAVEEFETDSYDRGGGFGHTGS